MPSSPKKCAIVILAARINILKDTLNFFYKNWNNKHKYPIYIHTFGKLITENKKREIHQKIDENIKFFEIYPEVPGHIKEEDLFYKRTYHQYVRESFNKNRIGFLHMCHFLFNITSKFGSKGCLVSELRKFDSIMWIDDETYFKKKIEDDFFRYSEDFPVVTASLTELKKTSTNLAVTENLWEFFRSYILNNKIEPKSEKLKDAIIKNNKDIIHEIEWPCGSTEVFSLKFFKNNQWKNYLDTINEYGGIYKYRWNPGYLITLYLMCFYKNPIYNLDYVKKDMIDYKIPGSGTPVNYYPKIYDLNFIKILYRKIIKLIGIK